MVSPLHPDKAQLETVGFPTFSEQPALLDFVAHFGSKLKIVPLVIDGPGLALNRCYRIWRRFPQGPALPRLLADILAP